MFVIVPHVTVFDVTVRENAGVVRVTFRRTGGDLSFSSQIEARTVAIPGKENFNWLLNTGTRLWDIKLVYWGLHAESLCQARPKADAINCG